MRNKWSMAGVKDAGFVVIGDGVYDLKSFAGRHPGGSFLSQLGGMDATFAILGAHGCRAEMPRAILSAWRRGGIAAEALSPADRDLHQLYRDFQARGLFRYRRRWLAVDALRMVALFVFALLLVPRHPWIGGVVLTTAYLNVIWWVHDVCHNSVFSTIQAAKKWAEAAAILFVGTSANDYQYRIHRIHHGFTNAIGTDHALETGPIVWDERMRTRTSAWWLRNQAWIWFAVVLPLTFPLFLVGAVYSGAKAKRWGMLSLMALRWALLAAAVVWLRLPVAALLLPLFLSGSLLGLFSSLNHFHLPMRDSLGPSYPRAMIEASQNFSETGPIATWLVGGLNFHIEHHLFPTMPRHNYRVIAPQIRRYCATHGFAYRTGTIPQAIGSLFAKLKSPFAGPMPASSIFRNRVDLAPVSAVAVGFALALAAVFGHASGGILWLLAGASLLLRLLAPLHQHCHAHVPVFRSRAANVVYDWILSVASGYTTAVWELQHVRGHHRHYLDPERDFAGVQRFAFSRRWPRRARQVVFTFLADALVLPDAWKIASWPAYRYQHWHRRLGMQLALQAASWMGLAWIDPIATLVAVVIPAILLRWFVVWGSFNQHDGVPATNTYDASMTSFGGPGALLLNVGHHTAHHEKPGLHWSRLPARTAEILHRIPETCRRGTPPVMREVRL